MHPDLINPARRKNRCCASPLHTQSGYVLVLTIAALALLGLVGAYMSQRISTSLRLAAAEQNYTQDERLARDTLARFTFLLATTQRNATGLGGDDTSLRMDGRWYAAGNDMAISFMDGRGLINMKTAPREWKERLLATYGIPTERIGGLLDALEDYADEDSLRHTMGAEAEDYARKKLPPPRNLPLVSTDELLRVYGWKDETKLWDDDGLLDHVTLGDATAVNPATATWRSMVASLEISPRVAQEFVEQRNKMNTAAAYALANTYATAANGQNIFQLHKAVMFPSTSTVITVASIGGRRAWRATLTLTPEAQKFAWVLPDLREISLRKKIDPKIVQELPDMTPFAVNVDKELKKTPF